MNTYSEPLVARVTGINKHTIVATRKGQLIKGDHWLVESNVVCFTQPGLEKLLGCLGLAGAGLVWPGEGEQGGAVDEARELAAAGGGEASQSPAEPAPGVEKIAPGPTCPPPAVGLPGVAIAGPAAAAVARAVEEIQGTELVELTVVKISHNPSLLTAKDKDGVRVPVRVASNINFLPGMKLKARPPAKGAQPIYAMVGHCPRWRGRF